MQIHVFVTQPPSHHIIIIIIILHFNKVLPFLLRFTVRAIVNGNVYPDGVGNNKKEAKQNAATHALRCLLEKSPDPVRLFYLFIDILHVWVFVFQSILDQITIFISYLCIFLIFVTDREGSWSFYCTSSTIKFHSAQLYKLAKWIWSKETGYYKGNGVNKTGTK